MSKFENLAFKKTQSPSAFNLIHQSPKSGLVDVFDTKPLEAFEVESLQKLLDESGLGERVMKDLDDLKQLTSEIKSISKQGRLLIGERIQKAHDLLQSYKDGTFTKWLDLAFSCRKTGYNMLSYYQLYKALPLDELKESFKKLPQKAAYALASRDGDLETKAKLIKDFNAQDSGDLLELIKEALPVTQSDKRSRSFKERLIADMKKSFQKLQARKLSLTDKDKKELQELSKSLATLLDM